MSVPFKKKITWPYCLPAVHNKRSNSLASHAQDIKQVQQDEKDHFIQIARRTGHDASVVCSTPPGVRALIGRPAPFPLELPYGLI